MMTSRSVLAAVLTLASQALAQGEPPPVPARDAAAPTTTPDVPDEPPYKPGFRAGGAVGIGAFLPAPAMLSFHLFDLHAGAQITQMWGAYARVGYSASIGFGISGGANGGAVSVSAAGLFLVGANAEVALGDTFFIAAGPQVGFGGWTRVGVAASTTGGGVTALLATGPMPGLDVKVGVGFGKPDRMTKRRGQFTIALDLSMLYATNVVDANVMGMARQDGASAGIAVSFADAFAIVPTLQLGYEFR
jgi:hypothetical protein